MVSAAFDLASPEDWATSEPLAFLARLRREDPVSFQEEASGAGFWAITKYADVVRIARDTSTFSSSLGGTYIEDAADHEMMSARRMMQNMDPPQHGRYRRMLLPWFTPRAVETLEPRIREFSRRLIHRVFPRGRCDLVTELAGELPLMVIAELMGIPDRDRPRMFHLSERLLGHTGAGTHGSHDAKVAAAEMYLYAQELAERLQREPGRDLGTFLVQTELDGRRLSPKELNALFLLLIVAGHETTRHLIAGGMLALMQHPPQRQRLTQNPGLLPSAVEEMLRWISPIIYFRRTATRDVEIRGKLIPKGAKVALYYISANRDEEAFPEADRFDVARSPNEHLAFGFGEHICLGAHLARVEARVFFEEILALLPDIELADEPKRLRSNFIHGLREMQVKFRPRG